MYLVLYRLEVGDLFTDRIDTNSQKWMNPSYLIDDPVGHNGRDGFFAIFRNQGKTYTAPHKAKVQHEFNKDY